MVGVMLDPRFMSLAKREQRGRMWEMMDRVDNRRREKYGQL